MRPADRAFPAATMPRFGATQTLRYLGVAQPLARVAPGERFRVETVNAFGRRFDNEQQFEAYMESPERAQLQHRATGPIAVDGANTDCSIAVHIHRIEIQSALHCISRSTGVLREEFHARQCRILPIADDGWVEMSGGLIAPRPSVGVVATTDERSVSCGRCSENGGNLDIPLVGPWSCVIVPVNHPQAGIAVGDVHARQGAGEAAGIALESDAWLELELGLVPRIPYPVIETPELIAIVGWGTQASAPCVAGRNAIDYLRRQRVFASRSDADLYQLLASFDLMPGNLTGAVSTYAIVMPKAQVVDPAGRRRVFLPAARCATSAEPGPEEAQELLGACAANFESLPLRHDGNSRQIRSVPDRPGLLIARLKDAFHSHARRGPVPAPGAGALRGDINAILSRVLHAAGIQTSTLASQGAFVLMKEQAVAERIEVIVKRAMVGSPKHRYVHIQSTPTRFGSLLSEGTEHPPYVRFDWRVATPGDDEVMPRELADYFIDTAAASSTALEAFACLRAFLRSRSFDLYDGCFFMNIAGDVICGEVSADNLGKLRYIGNAPELREPTAAIDRSITVARWRAICESLGG